jgi:cytochrome c oxidase subunit 2
MTNAIDARWRTAGGFMAGAGMALCGPAAHAEGPRDALVRLTADSYDLHLALLYAVLAAWAVAFALMFRSMLAHRRTSARQSQPFHRSAATEFLWAAVPCVILFAAAWPAASRLAGVADPSGSDITIRATGQLWKWGYRYEEGAGAGVAFDSNVYAPRRQATDAAAGGGTAYALDVDHPVVVPVGKRIRLVLVSSEGIHSWHVPDLGVKEYAVPGLVRETWFRARRTGTYRGVCTAEACGAGRVCPLIVVKVVSEADYPRWVARAKGNLAANI